jgi:hypothetical protein
MSNKIERMVDSLLSEDTSERDEEEYHFVPKELEKRNEVLFQELVPVNGAADTVEGEVLRAINKICYRSFNDGDYYFAGYGVTAAGPAHAYLLDKAASIPALSGLRKMLPDRGPSGNYSQALIDALELVVSWIESRNGETTPNSDDMLKWDPVNAEEDDDEWDDEEDEWDDDED